MSVGVPWVVGQIIRISVRDRGVGSEADARSVLGWLVGWLACCSIFTFGGPAGRAVVTVHFIVARLSPSPCKR